MVPVLRKFRLDGASRTFSDFDSCHGVVDVDSQAGPHPRPMGTPLPVRVRELRCTAAGAIDSDNASISQKTRQCRLEHQGAPGRPDRGEHGIGQRD